MNEIKGVRKKIVDVMSLIFAIGIFTSLMVSAFSFIGYLIAIIIGGDVASEICSVIYKSIYPILFTFTSCVVLFGLLKMYVAGEKALNNKRKSKTSIKQTENTNK